MFLRGTEKPGALNGFFSFSFYAKDDYFNDQLLRFSLKFKLLKASQLY